MAQGTISEIVGDADTARPVRLAVRLLKPRYTPEQALRQSARDRLAETSAADQTASTPVGDDGGDGLPTLLRHAWPGRDDIQVYAGTAYAREVGWATFVRQAAPSLPQMQSQAPGAVIFIPVTDKWTEEKTQRQRWMTVTFGLGHLWLGPGSFVRDFGLRVAINVVDPARIRSADLAQPNRTTLQRRVQASKPADRRTLEIDPERDLLRGVTGKVKDTTFARTLTGASSLLITCPLSAKELESKCSDALKRYHATDYQHAGFEWVGRLRPVQDDSIRQKLDEKLQDALTSAFKGSELDDLSLAPPEVVDYKVAGDYVYGGLRSKTAYPEIDLADYIEELRKAQKSPTLDDARRHSVAQIIDGQREDLWIVYDCVVFGTKLGAISYVLWAGEWHQISESFIRELDQFLLSIARTVIMPSAINRGAVNEKIYNEKIVPKACKDWVCVDTKTVIVEGWRTGIEPCDFLTPDREFVHIKDGTSSSTLSHLFNQGLVCADALTQEPAFRVALRAEIGELCKKQNKKDLSKLLPTKDAPPGQQSYTVVYAIIREDPWKDFSQLPFFSKVTLRNAVRDLNRLGFRVALQRVPKDRVSKKAGGSGTRQKKKR